MRKFNPGDRVVNKGAEPDFPPTWQFAEYVKDGENRKDAWVLYLGTVSATSVNLPRLEPWPPMAGAPADDPHHIIAVG